MHIDHLYIEVWNCVFLCNETQHSQYSNNYSLISRFQSRNFVFQLDSGPS